MERYFWKGVIELVQKFVQFFPLGGVEKLN